MFLQLDNATLLFHFLHLESLEELFLSLRLNYDVKYKSRRITVSLAYKIFRAISELFFSGLFLSSNFDGYFILFQSYFFIKVAMFEALSRCVSISWWFKATVAAYWKLLLSPFFRFIVAFLFFNYTGESMYDRPHLKVTVWHLKCIYWTKSKTKSLLLIQVSELFRYLERRDSKSSLTTSFTSL